MSDALNNRYDFMLIFDVCDGNPNGDPDAGNLPRIDAETGMGLVTDVCLKRKIRNYVQLTKNLERPYDIYVREKAVLGRAHTAVYKELGIDVGEEASCPIPEDLQEAFDELTLADGLSILHRDEKVFLIAAPDVDKDAIKNWLKEDSEIPSKCSKLITSLIKSAKPRKLKQEEVTKGQEKMCADYYDIRTFGAVMSLKSAPNCGQVRGPVQLTFARSSEPVVALEHSITRMAVATEAEAEKQQGDNRTMGRKATIPYGLYIAKGFVSPQLANKTGFTQSDLELLFQAMTNMFEYDHSAARGMMSTRKLVVFKHQDALGNAPAWKLFDLVSVKTDNKTPRQYSDYKIEIDREHCPDGVEILDLV